MTSSEFEKKYEYYRPKVRYYMYSHLQNSETADDLTSDVFLKAFEKLPSFDESQSAFSTWIYTVARNRLIDYYRTNRFEEELTESIPENTDILEQIVSKNAFEIIKKAVISLPEKERTVILLHYYRKMTLKDIGVKMHFSYAYIKVLHKNALNLLKKEIDI